PASLPAALPDAARGRARRLSARVATSGRGVAGELAHQARAIELVPVLGHLTVADPEDVDLVDRVALAGRLHAHELAGVLGARGEPRGDQVALGDEIVDLESRSRDAGACPVRGLSQGVATRRWRAQGVAREVVARERSHRG